MIEFSIEKIKTSSTYQAEEGMTWIEWCNSEYNIDGYIYDNSNNTVLRSDRMWYLTNFGSAVRGAQIIEANKTYYLNPA